ncbi:MAG: hypothetical protein A3F41_02175 [Coxiella sp. RIFCSPHIGHO2_12_FULL_44_14]|nr:MAG: hypothetical protein A3F41_02175 [Coxiella sp. RIFCSPHIGHO2_12_FULL_44_14]
MPENNKNAFPLLPTELNVFIFSFLSPPEAVTIAAVNNSWREMAFSNVLWNIYFKRDFNVTSSDNDKSFTQYLKVLKEALNHQTKEIQRLKKLFTHDYSHELYLIEQMLNGPVARNFTGKLKTLLGEACFEIFKQQLSSYDKSSFKTFEEIYQIFPERKHFLNQVNTEIVKKGIGKKFTKALNPNRAVFLLTEQGLQTIDRRSTIKLNLTGLITRLTPDSITNCMLYNVEDLRLSATMLSAIPDNFSDLTTLRKLFLRHNELCHLPSNVSQLKHLEELDVSNNFLNGIPEIVYSLKNLKILNMGNFKPSMTTCVCCDPIGQRTTGNRITTLPAEINQLTQLEYLNLMSVGLMALPDDMSRLSRLTLLNLFHNNIQNLPSRLPPRIQEQRRGLWVAGNPLVFYRPLSISMDQFSTTAQIQIIHPTIRIFSQMLGKLFTVMEFLHAALLRSMNSMEPLLYAIYLLVFLLINALFILKREQEQDQQQTESPWLRY